MKDRSHDEAMVELLREDPAYAVDLLNSILEGGEPGELVTPCAKRPKPLAR